MKSFILIFIFIMSLVFSNTSNATLITDSSLLTSDNYVTYVGDDITIDFAWASIVNVEYWGDPDDDAANRLYAPELHEGWGYASDSDIDVLLANFTIDNFSNDDGTYIQAVSFWNTFFDDAFFKNYVSNLMDYTDGLVSSRWASAGVDGREIGDSGHETFYVRKTLTPSTDLTPIPEPLSILLFAAAFIIFQTKSRKNSA